VPPEKPAEKPPEKPVAAAERKDEVVRVLGPAKDPQVVWALSNRGRDRMALVALQKTRGWETVVFEDPVADVGNAVISRVSGLPLIATAQPGYPRFEILDDKLRDDLGPLLATMGDKRFGLSIASMDRSERHMVVSLYTSTRHDSYLVNRDARTFERLATSVPEDMTRALAETRALTIQSRDGLALPAYLTLPRGVAAKGLPMVLLVHGGPWAQTPWADPLRSDDSARAQFLANRGYAVLQVDFRGSTGFGRAFSDAGIDEFGRRMQDDLVDSARWAVSQGIADPARIGIMGLSYGGYATLNALAATPRTFACGVSIGGPTDLATLIESFPPYWVDLSNWHEFVGNPKVVADRAEMTERSPLTHARDIDKPVLLIHGARDVRVRLDQSQRMEQALRAAGKPVRLVTIAEMGHVPSYWAHQQKTLRETESFFHDCLGGRAVKVEPFDWLAWIWTKIS
jgi:dipeptidyl aminopeptidase/acylaminoacyl peptidase